MNTKLHYDTAAIAIQELNRQGYIIDFNLEKNRLIGQGNQYDVDDFKIRDIYRYEGISDPADEVVVYALESNDGQKGVFVAGYGASADAVSALILERLKRNE